MFRRKWCYTGCQLKIHKMLYWSTILSFCVVWLKNLTERKSHKVSLLFMILVVKSIIIHLFDFTCIAVLLFIFYFFVGQCVNSSMRTHIVQLDLCPLVSKLCIYINTVEELYLQCLYYLAWLEHNARDAGVQVCLSALCRADAAYAHLHMCTFKHKYTAAFSQEL